jgi:hypothetical protein
MAVAAFLPSLLLAIWFSLRTSRLAHFSSGRVPDSQSKWIFSPFFETESNKNKRSGRICRGQQNRNLAWQLRRREKGRERRRGGG